MGFSQLKSSEGDETPQRMLNHEDTKHKKPEDTRHEQPEDTKHEQPEDTKQEKSEDTKHEKPEDTKLEDIYDQVLGRQKENWLLGRVRRLERWAGFLTPLRWTNLIATVLFHLIALVWTLYYLWTRTAPMWQTVVFGFVIMWVAGFGVTGGVHRYWSHRSYKATMPLQILLLACFSIAGQNNVYNWVRDHRVHHKYSETLADPHDANRGFFFSHIGWLMMKKHPEVLRKGNSVNMDDILSDPLLQFHTRYFKPIKILSCFVVPSLVPALCWGEQWGWAVLSQAVLRYIATLHITWSVNSFAHFFGYKPYDKDIHPVENLSVSMFSMGEGWHNYHHTFPWDYRAGEVGGALALFSNWTTALLCACKTLNFAYDMKVASPALVAAVKSRNHHVE